MRRARGHAAARGAAAVPARRVRRGQSREIRFHFAAAARSLHAPHPRRRALQRRRSISGAVAARDIARSRPRTGARDPGRNRTPLRSRRLDRRRPQQARGQDGGGGEQTARADGVRRAGVPRSLLAARCAGAVGSGPEAGRAHARPRHSHRGGAGERADARPERRLRHHRPAVARSGVGTRRDSARAGSATRWRADCARRGS